VDDGHIAAPVPQPERGTGRPPEVLAVAEGSWVEKAPPSLQAQFRCIGHGRGSVVEPDRWARHGVSRPASSPDPQQP
jgi:hypothetical protein